MASKSAGEGNCLAFEARGEPSPGVLPNQASSNYRSRFATLSFFFGTRGTKKKETKKKCRFWLRRVAFKKAPQNFIFGFVRDLRQRTDLGKIKLKFEALFVLFSREKYEKTKKYN